MLLVTIPVVIVVGCCIKRRRAKAQDQQNGEPNAEPNREPNEELDGEPTDEPNEHTALLNSKFELSGIVHNVYQ